MREKQEKSGWSRREFLKGAGVAIGLPFFPSLFPRTAWADSVRPPARMMFMCVPLGFVPNKSIGNLPAYEAIGSKGWFPEEEGQQYKMPEVHASLEPYREHISFLKGMSNHKYRGDSHIGNLVFLTCADTYANPAKAFSNTGSCDQLAAGSEIMGGQNVRYPSLALGVGGQMALSWTENGVPISPMKSPAQVFDLLFGKEDLPAATRLQRLRQKRSFLDVTLKQIQRLNRDLNAADRAKLDEVLTAVRGVEANIQREEKWMNFEKPRVSFARPDESTSTYSIRHAQTMFELAHAAFLTDSTRVITYEMPASFTEVTPIEKHVLNHTGDPAIAKAAVNVDRAMSEQVAHFIKLLCESKEHDGQPLIQNTLAAYGSGSWGAIHGLRSLPLMLIGHGGGKIKQGTTRKYDDKTPMANLWLTMLQAVGVMETDRNGKPVKDGAGNPVALKTFADSTGTLEGLI